MRTTILFLSMAMLFVISPYVHAQEVCYPGLEQIPQVLNEDALDFLNFVEQGGVLFGSRIPPLQESGNVLGLGIIRASGSINAKIALYQDVEGHPHLLLTENAPQQVTLPGVPQMINFQQSPRVDTTEVMFEGLPIYVEAGTSLWASIKFAATGPRLLRQFPEADGLRFTLTNPFANAFPADISSLGSLNVTNGIYGIYLIMEDCQDPPPVDCTGLPVSYRADFNQDGIVSVDDLPVILGSFGSTGDCEDLNVDGFVNASDLGIFLSTFGATVDWQNIPE